MKTNTELQKDVQDALKWEPSLHAAEIGVIVKEGVVTLTGTVDTYAKKLEAENATKNVLGVSALIEKIEVQFPDNWSKSDDQIAREVIQALEVDWQVPRERIRIIVEDGWITLEGEIPWNYQRDAAEEAVKSLSGINGVLNRITIEPNNQNGIEKKEIENALKRNASLQGCHIKVEVVGSQVTLTGKVATWPQKKEAGRTAWNTPGIWILANDLVVEAAESVPVHHHANL